LRDFNNPPLLAQELHEEIEGIPAVPLPGLRELRAVLEEGSEFVCVAR
jgi:hypothetical protein